MNLESVVLASMMMMMTIATYVCVLVFVDAPKVPRRVSSTQNFQTGMWTLVVKSDLSSCVHDEHWDDDNNSASSVQKSASERIPKNILCCGLTSIDHKQLVKK